MNGERQDMICTVAKEFLRALVSIRVAQDLLAKGICLDGEAALEKAARHTSKAIELLPALAKQCGSRPLRESLRFCDAPNSHPVTKRA
jgi:hypothetical protein